jgi:hypothetical protein
MSTGVIVIIVAVGFLAGGILALKSSARTGMPSQDVLDRAARRARELEAREKAGEAEESGDPKP